MPFWVKDSAYSWSPVKELWVKVASNGSGAWQLASEAWVKVSSTGASAWKKFYTNTSLKPYSTVPISIRTSSYTGTNVSGSYTYVGTKLWGNESVSPTNYWQNGPFTSTSYNWYYSTTSDGSGLLDGYTNIDTFDSTYYDGYYIYFQVKKTNSRGLSGTEISAPAYICLHVPTHGTNTFGLTTTAAQVGTPITFAYSWKNSSSYGIDTSRSTIEWYRGYPYADKRNLIESKTYSQLVATSYGSDYYGTYSYTPVTADLNNNIYVVSTAYNSYTDYTSSPIVDTYSSDVIYTKPIINNPVTINKDSGYQTYGYSLSSNTQTYTPTADTVYWGWQYASSNTATTGKTFYHYIPVVYIQVNDSGSESSEGVTHTFTLKDVIDSTTGNSVSLIGKYLRFYSIGQKGNAQSDVNYSDWIGPIYDMVGSQGSPTIVWYQDGKATAYWPSATNAYYYWLEYSSDQSVWTRTGSIQYSAPTINSQANYTSLPLGVYYYRVVAYNADNVPSYSSAISFDSAPPKESFAFGDTLYIGTNGYISFNQGNSVPNITQTIGKVFGFYPGDLIADNISYASIHAEDGNDYFIIYWQGHRYSAITSYPLNEIKIEIWIPQPSSWYGNPVVFAYYSLSSITNNTIKDLNYPGYYYNGIKKSIGNSYAANGNDSQFYLDATSNTLILKSFSYKGSSWAGWIQLASNASADDTYYTLTSFIPSAPSAPTNVTYDSVTQTSAVVRWNAPLNLGSTKFYQYEYSVNNGSWVGIGNQLFAYISNLTTGSTNNTVRIRGVNYSGLTSTSYGTTTFDTLSGPSAFTTTSGSKGFPSGAIQSASEPSGNRTVTVGWNSSANSVGYEVALQGSTDNSTWSYVTIGGSSQTLDNSAYVLSGTSKTFTAPYYRYYRYTVRGRGSDYSLSNAVYSDSGTSTGLVWKNVDGTNPSAPSIGTITPGTGSSYTTASIAFTTTSSPGSNTINWNQYSLNNTNWTNIYVGPISLTGLSASTDYTIYMRSWNYDDLYSGSTSKSFTTNSNPAVSQSTAPTAKATGTNSTTTVKYGDTITWSAGTYNNASTITSVLIYSTNTANLVSPNGDTNSLTRTSNPYTISTADPSGTPYVFTVRDKVVGTNGTTYYFYSNQITSALADAVAFSYNTGVSANGGWSATVATAQTGATYSITATTGYSVNSSTGAVTVTGLGSNVSSSITVTKSVSGYNDTTAIASGTSNTVVTNYTITYAGNGSTSGSTTSTTGNGSVTLRANGFTRTNCTFAGWNTAADGSGTSYSAGGSYALNADVTLYATWAAVTNSSTNPTVTFVGNFGSGSTSYKRWNWSGGTVTGGTAVGYQYAISSTSSTGGFGSYSATTTATTIDITVANAASNPRWLKVRRVYTDGLGVTQYSGANNGV
jgi:hypothetical protein